LLVDWAEQRERARARKGAALPEAATRRSASGTLKKTRAKLDHVLQNIAALEAQKATLLASDDVEIAGV